MRFGSNDRFIIGLLACISHLLPFMLVTVTDCDWLLQLQVGYA